jgi:hypothetical protein
VRTIRWTEAHRREAALALGRYLTPNLLTLLPSWVDSEEGLRVGLAEMGVPRSEAEREVVRVTRTRIRRAP